MAFPGDGCRCYVALCDGMGTGLGAALEGENAISLLRKMLTGGFSPEQALCSINSILVLGGKAGAVTLDLAEVFLDSGKAVLYKWGAAPSCLITHRGVEQLGTVTPPPGFSVRAGRASRVQLSLCQGQSLVLLSDGAETALWQTALSPDMTTDELAEAIVSQTRGKQADDTTVAVLRLLPLKEKL